MTLEPRVAFPFLLLLLLPCAGEAGGAAGATACHGGGRHGGRPPAENSPDDIDPSAIILPAVTFWEGLEYFFLPDCLRHMRRLRRFIASDAFPAQFGALPPPGQVDAVWYSAAAIAEGDPFDALLASCFATLPYRTFDAVIPLVGWVVTLPVSTESREQFRRRLEHLPAGFLPDSPPRGDRDKMTHFFGSAYLAAVTKSPLLARRAGLWVEALEKAFKLEGFNDERDIWINARGAEFAQALLAHRNLPPSRFFRHPATNSDR